LRRKQRCFSIMFNQIIMDYICFSNGFLCKLSRSDNQYKLFCFCVKLQLEIVKTKAEKRWNKTFVDGEPSNKKLGANKDEYRFSFRFLRSPTLLRQFEIRKNKLYFRLYLCLVACEEALGLVFLWFCSFHQKN
jgi:hypothetical protein